jgi:predicted lipoprotein with Yx(FWY)xxD motif
MRTQVGALSALALLAVSFASIPSTPKRLNSPKDDYPAEVALAQREDRTWIYQSFPALLPLYVFEGDSPGKSACDEVCIAVWPAVRAPANAKPVGDWTVIVRPSGYRQWAYKSRPVYTFFQDTPNNPKGVGKEEDWYFHVRDAAATNKTNANVSRSGKPHKKPTWQLLVP